MWVGLTQGGSCESIISVMLSQMTQLIINQIVANNIGFKNTRK